MHSKSLVVNLAEQHETPLVNKCVAVCKSVEATVIYEGCAHSFVNYFIINNILMT